MATEAAQVYKCDKCGIIVEVLRGGLGSIVCCGAPARLLVGNTTDAAKEKHVPVVTPEGSGTKVSVGSVAHPMTEEHYIEWVEVLVGARTIRQSLAPGQAPEATFCIPPGGVAARAYCNLHGLWKGEG